MKNKFNTLIIAEAGVNHNGDITLAKKLIDEAANAGADIVKFQTFIAENVISASASKADYQINNTGQIESQLQMVKKLELKFDDFVALKKHADTKGIMFLSTPFDIESIHFLNNLGLPIFKIPSGEITNLPYLELIASFNKEVIMSTGMATIDEIEEAINILTSHGTQRDKISLLHCNTEYPTPFTDVNLKAMYHLSNQFGLKVGYSDHTLGIEIPIAAVAMGACIIEKHFTLDKKMDGPDHVASLEPDELRKMVDAIRNIEQALGSGFKSPSASEKKNIVIARKSIHLKRALVKGSIITADDLIMKRPGDGISPLKYHEVIGKKLNDDFDADHKLNMGDYQ
jgi:N,N'-diacetyllegionaminate synthase